MPGFSITLHLSQHHHHPTSGRVVPPLCHCSYPSLHALCLRLAEELCHDCLMPCFFLYYDFSFFSPDSNTLQLTGREVEAFHKNLNSFSCLSNNRIWILNLQYIYIYTSDITVKGKTFYFLCFLLYVISAGNQKIFTYHGD